MLFKKLLLSSLFSLAFAACAFAQSTTTVNWAYLRNAMISGSYTDFQLGADITPAATAGAMNNPTNSQPVYSVNGNGYNFINAYASNPLTFFQTSAAQTVTLQNINFVNSFFNGSTRILINGGTAYMSNITASSNSATTATGNIIRNQATATLLDISNSIFSYNTSAGLAVVYNMSLSNITNSTFSYNTSTLNAGSGAAISNSGTVYVTSATFQNNTAGATGNATGSLGGAIYNAAASVANIDGSIFDSNRAIGTNSHGGAIYNNGTMTINSSIFNANGLGQAGAVTGGAIYNAVGSSLDITGTNGASSFTGNVAASANSRGGAIDNEGMMTITNANFSGNLAGTSANGGDLGGAIYVGVTGDLTVTDSNFDSNKAQSPASPLSHGGAIASDGVLTVQAENSPMLFSNNTATGQGGAIRIGATGTLYLIADNNNITFSNNTSGTSGGAVQGVAGSVLNLTANNGNIIFTGNYSGNNGGSANGLNIGSTANLNVVNGNIIFNDGIASSVNTPTLPVNLNISGVNGNVVLNADMRGNGSSTAPLGYNGTITLNSGTIKVINDTWFFNSPFVGNGGTIDRQGETANGVALGTPLNISNFTMNNDVNTKIDVDLLSATGSYFAGAPAGTGKLMISDISLLSNKTGTTDVPVADAAAMNNVGLASPYVLNGALYSYNVSYLTNATDGYLEFAAAGFAPSSYIPQVTMQTGGYYNQLNAYSMVFDYLNAYNPGDPDAERCSSCDIWVRPYGYREKVDFRDGIKVNNAFAGIYAGIDTRKLSLGKGFYTGFSLFGGYNEGWQDYTDVSISQKSGTLGAAADLYIGHFFTGLTVSGSKGTSDANTSYLGEENLNVNTLGVAMKAGYNARLSSIFILQPAITFSYTQVGLDNYTNAGGLPVNAQSLTPLAAEPAIKLLASINDKTYANASLSYLYNIDDKSQAFMDSTELPQIYINNYLQGTVGITRQFTDSFSGGINLYGRVLDRMGVGATIDLRYSFCRLCFWEKNQSQEGQNNNNQNAAGTSNNNETGAQNAAGAQQTGAASNNNNNAAAGTGASNNNAGGNGGQNQAGGTPAAGTETSATTAPAASAASGQMLFDFDSYALRPATKAELERIAKKLQDGDYRSIVVEGHTDSIGTAEYNMQLSLRRANAGRDYLIQLGLDGKRITVKGFGLTRPVDTNKTPEGRQQNRRIEVDIKIM